MRACKFGRVRRLGEWFVCFGIFYKDVWKTLKMLDKNVSGCNNKNSRIMPDFTNQGYIHICLETFCMYVNHTLSRLTLRLFVLFPPMPPASTKWHFYNGSVTMWLQIVDGSLRVQHYLTLVWYNLVIGENSYRLGPGLSYVTHTKKDSVGWGAGLSDPVDLVFYLIWHGDRIMQIS